VNRGPGNPLGLGLVIVGAFAMAIAAFLPLDEPTGVFRMVRDNTLIQRGGWILIALAVGIAAAGFRVNQRKGNGWALPVVLCVLAAFIIVTWAADKDLRTLYPISANGIADTSQPGMVASLGIAIYVAGAGVAVALIGSLMLRQTEHSRARAAAGVATRRRPETWPRPNNAHPAGPPVPPPRSADRPPPQIGTPPPLAGHRPRRWLKWPLIAAIVGILAAAGITGYLVWPNASRHPPAPPVQTVLPFTDLGLPHGVAVDTTGNVYVMSGDRMVLKLAAGSNTQTVLPFTGLKGPEGVAVDTAGNVYVTDEGNSRVLKLPAGSSTETVLPFTGLKWPGWVAVDSTGNLYVTDRIHNLVLKLAAGSNTPRKLAFTGLTNPIGVAVDTAGNVYVTDEGNSRVLKLSAGSSTQTVLPFTGLKGPEGVAVDSAGNLYVTDPHNNRVLTLAAASNTPTVLPFTGLTNPTAVAVDSAGNVYVTDPGNHRVVKLAAG
jgi:serine/threonine protein kinase, bacterial